MKIFWASIFFIMISGTSMADDFFNPPPLNPELPPWMQNQQEQNQPNQQPQQPAPDTSVPAAEAPSFDSGSSSDEEDGGSPFDFEGGSEGGGGGGRDSGKSNFQVLDPGSRQSQQNQQDCVGWGSSFLGTKIFTSESTCKIELEQDIENARDAINNYVDFTEKEVLRGVIRGKIAREQSKDFQLDFTSLKNSLISAAKTGCSCLE